jgi:L-ascorbate metabolism protein UlaG (beta-lactamase superfamily)
MMGRWRPMDPYPKHFDGKRFFNPDAPQAMGFREVIRWQRTRQTESSPEFLDDVRPSKPPARVQNGIRITMVNHSTLLLQLAGMNLLTDPIWSERASPFAWAGPRRRRRPGVAFEDLPPIDGVLISHNHYDHMDLPTLRRLEARERLAFVLPVRAGAPLHKRGIGPLQELDWGESLTVGQCTVHCLPSFHFSSRWLSDRNRTLWCGYWIECQGRRVYFAGDTAFGDHFSWIRERHGAPEIALLPIGAYEPRWFMSPVHMGPDQALRAHQILDAERSIAIHHGTFQLADEGVDTPANELRKRLRGESFRVLANGGVLEVP